MIRLLLDKARVTSTSAVIKSIVKPVLPLQGFRLFSNQISKSSGLAEGFAKDIIVYKYENPRFFKLMNIFAISQFVFWGYLGQWSYTSLRDVKVSEEVKDNDELSWWRKINLGEDKYKSTLGVVCFGIGYLVIFLGWTFTLKSVRYLIANKNGKDISLVTYTPFGQNRILTVPLSCISAQESRTAAKVYLPLKVKNKKFYYILDMKGEFKNTRMFDQTIGLRRKFAE